MMDGLETIFVLAIALLTYALPTAIGGNGYLATYLAGIIIGNGAIPDKVTLVNFFDGLNRISSNSNLLPTWTSILPIPNAHHFTTCYPYLFMANLCRSSINNLLINEAL